MKERKAIVKENGTTVFKTINSSANVRLSEFKRIAEAMDAGFVADMNNSYHAIVGFAREHLAENGKKDGRGRKATHGIVKAMKYLAKLEGIDETDTAMIAAMLQAAEEYCIQAGLAIDKTEE